MTWQEAAEACGVKVTHLDDPLHQTHYFKDAAWALAFADMMGWVRFRIEPDGETYD